MNDLFQSGAVPAILLASGLTYGLRLGGQDIAPDHGPAHLQRCLRALALA